MLGALLRLRAEASTVAPPELDAWAGTLKAAVKAAAAAIVLRVLDFIAFLSCRGGAFPNAYAVL